MNTLSNHPKTQGLKTILAAIEALYVSRELNLDDLSPEVIADNRARLLELGVLSGFAFAFVQPETRFREPVTLLVGPGEIIDGVEDTPLITFSGLEGYSEAETLLIHVEDEGVYAVADQEGHGRYSNLSERVILPINLVVHLRERLEQSLAPSNELVKGTVNEDLITRLTDIYRESASYKEACSLAERMMATLNIKEANLQVHPNADSNEALYQKVLREMALDGAGFRESGTSLKIRHLHLLAAGGGLVGLEQAASDLHIDLETLTEKCANGELIAIQYKDGKPYYGDEDADQEGVYLMLPQWQIVDSRLLEGLKEVLVALKKVWKEHYQLDMSEWLAMECIVDTIFGFPDQSILEALQVGDLESARSLINELRPE